MAPKFSSRIIHSYQNSFFKLILILLSVVISHNLFAGNISGSDITITSTHFNNSGYIDVKVPIYCDHGNDEGLPDSDKYHSVLKIDGVEVMQFKSMTKPGSPQTEASWYWVQTKLLDAAKNFLAYAEVEESYGSNNSYGITTSYVESKHNKTDWNSTSSASYRLYPSTEFLKNKNESENKSIKIEVILQIDVNNSSSDFDVYKSADVTFAYPKEPELSYTYSPTPGRYRVSFEGLAGDDYIFGSGDKKTHIEEKGKVNYDYLISEYPINVYFHYFRNLSTHQSIEVGDTIKLPAYKMPQQLLASQNAEGNVDMSWVISSSLNPDDDPTVTGDEIEIQRATNPNFSDAITVASKEYLGTQTYRYTDEVKDNNFTGTYYYRLRRTASKNEWGWDYYQSMTCRVEMKHKYVSTASAEMNDSGEVEIHWTYNSGNILSTGSVLKLTRLNETTGNSVNFTLPDECISSGFYREALPTTCDVYSYKIQIVPGSKNYSEQDPVAVSSGEDGLYSVYRGQVTSFTASKGYFSDRIEFEWKSESKGISSFVIKAKEYGSFDDFKQIASITAGSSNQYYSYSYDKGVPGVVYEFQISALSECGGTTLEIPFKNTEIGFRTPTGEIYGRVTFENGQAVSDAEVRAVAEEGANIPGKSFVFDGNGLLTVSETLKFDNAPNKATLEAWIKPAGDGTIIELSDMYKLAYSENKIKFSIGEQTVISESELRADTSSSPFVHICGTIDEQYAYIYINGKQDAKVPRTGIVDSHVAPVVIGDGYKGVIDEVRIWSTDLDSLTVAQNYNRILVGNESGLEAYYNFDYSVANEFYDISYTGTNYHKHHGVASGVQISETEIPDSEQLGFRYYTDNNGSYTLRGLPYIGNGTSYMIIPRKGTHSFMPEKELRIISAQSQSHTVNFTDKSSFPVSGKVTYEGSTIPVQGVSFLIDGVTAMDSKTNIIMTDAAGMFTINVPVGQHEVKASKNGHVFKNGGRITNSDGTDRNYQDMISDIELVDSTTVRYIGRVAGGNIQKDIDLGHSLSKNNLADGIKVTLTYNNDAYVLSSEPKDTVLEHVKNVYITKPKTNKVNYSGNVVTIYPNEETGEFYADVIPEKYTVNVSIPGHNDKPVSGSGEEMNFISTLEKQFSTHSYVDSISQKDTYINKTDSVPFNKKSLFIKRYTPSIIVSELSNGNPKNYYGQDTVNINLGDNKNSFKAVTFDKTTGQYLFGLPVYEQNQDVTFGINTAETYVYMDSNGKPKEGIEPDYVPVSSAILDFTGTDLALNSDTTIITNAKGYGEWTFKVNSPEMTSATRKVAMKMTYVDTTYDSSSPTGSEMTTTIDWTGKYDAIVLGANLLGNNFITAGPDELLFVLRDPPGSNSYSYLEAGVTTSKSSTYTGSFDVGLDVDFGSKMDVAVLTYAGVGVGEVTTAFEFQEEGGASVAGAINVGGSDTDTRTVTTTSKFQTSSDPLYVGADGDLYVGFSTNITLGNTENVSIITKDLYNANPGNYTVYSDISKSDDPYILVKTDGIGMSQNFSTLFTYPQAHIERTLIPTMIETRNSLLHQEDEGLDFQALANNTKSNVYVSKLKPSDPNYGKSNNDPVFTEKLEDAADGQSYKIYFPTTAKESGDTIMFLNQSVDNWKKHLRNNEQQKVNAVKKQNVSFQGGSDFSYSESYSVSRSETVDFSVGLSASAFLNIGTQISGTGVIFNFKSHANTTHGGSFNNTETAQHCKGFVLSESGGDYLSVDVCLENGYNKDDEYIKYDELSDPASSNPTFSNFIFKTQGGATRCPYEGGYKTKYYEPIGTIIDQPTLQVEVPEVSVENNFIENVPSGEPARFTLYFRNNSQTQKDLYYDFSVDDATNPNGAQFFIDGGSLGNGRTFFIPAGETITKTLEIKKGSVMNYDNIVFWLSSQCQCDLTNFQDDIYDAISLSVHFTPSATSAKIKKPSDNWTYNTKLPTVTGDDGIIRHYMDIAIDGFDVNYDNFRRIMLQYKPKSGSDYDWVTLMSYYADENYYNEAVSNGLNAQMISSSDAGTINYQWFMDDMPDQKYDLRVVGTSVINNEEYYNYSDVYSGIKDMYNPRLFGSAQPANGILTVNDEIRLNFNEQIAEGLLTDNNFEITGVRNGATTDHSVSVTLDGENDALNSEFSKNWTGKNLTVEMWILPDAPQDAVLFSQGNSYSPLELAITKDNHLKVTVGNNTIISADAISYEQGNWAHVAMTCSADGTVSAYYDFIEVISNVKTDGYTGTGGFSFGASTAGNNHFAGKMHNARIWDKICSASKLQTNSLTILSGNETNLLAYYPMNEAKGNIISDKAHGVNLTMTGGEWSVPEGRAVKFNGTDEYVKINSSATVIDNSMDFTLELWFKAEESQASATIVSNGKGDGADEGGSKNYFSLNIENGTLCLINNNVTTVCEGTYADNDWHHFALAVNRTSGRGQIYIDGNLNTYFDATDFGGVESNHITLGARLWCAEGKVDYTADNFFKGTIDEFRLWNLYKNEKLVADGALNKLSGKEKGLLAYYPFEHYVEWQGSPELQFTLDDQKVKDADDTETAEVVGGNVETSASAPVKAKEPVSSLLYNFVVNNDALIITLNEPYDRIEKSTVNFTVDGVRDMNGNEIVSPITWSAYIDRNQTKWSDTEINVNKKAGEEYSFTVQAVNMGGSVQYFTVENAPSWLEVSPAAGTIDPASHKDIKFTIDPGLNIGNYEEYIYLRNDNNVTESLAVNVKVEGEKPNWAVNPADYIFSLSVFGKIKVGAFYSSDEGDILAAFDENNNCIGLCNNTYSKTNDMYYAMLTIYGNDVTNDNISFRIWDASTGTTYIAKPDPDVKFECDAVAGTPDNPVVFTSQETRVQTLVIEQGWNWLSFNTLPINSGINSTLSGTEWTSEDIIKSEEGGFITYTSGQWVGTLNSFDVAKMYKFHSPKYKTLDIYGTPVDTKNTPVKIFGKTSEGKLCWSYISYLPQVNMHLKDALADYDASEGDVIKSQTQMAMYSDNLGWVGSLEYMEPGKGYMLQRQNSGDVTFTYPAAVSAYRTSSETVTKYDFKHCETNQTAVVEISGIEVLPGDELVAYIDNEVCGTVEVTEMPSGSPLFFMNITGHGDVPVDLALVRDGEILALAKSALDYSADKNVGTVSSPLEIYFSEENGIYLYPNPFKEVLNIRVSADENAVIDIYITGISGKILASWKDCNNAGQANVSWTDAGTIPDGIYIVTVVTNGKPASIKAIKK